MSIILDGNDITYMALDLGRQAMEHCSPNKLDDPNHKSTCLHKWQFLQGNRDLHQSHQKFINHHLYSSMLTFICLTWTYFFILDKEFERTQWQCVVVYSIKFYCYDCIHVAHVGI